MLNKRRFFRKICPVRTGQNWKIVRIKHKIASGVWITGSALKLNVRSENFDFKSSCLHNATISKPDPDDILSILAPHYSIELIKFDRQI